MKKLFVLLALSLMFACGDPSDANDDTELGSAKLALETSTATHTYRLNGQLQVWRAGAHLLDVDLSGAAPAVLIPNLAPGNYDLFLNVGGLTRDGVPYAATLVGPNPFLVTVAPGATTNVPLTFTVVGDAPEPPVVFDPGALNVSVVVTEVPPS